MTPSSATGLEAAGVSVRQLEWAAEEWPLMKAKTGLGFSYFVNHRTGMWIGLDDDWAVAAVPEDLTPLGVGQACLYRDCLIYRETNARHGVTLPLQNAERRPARSEPPSHLTPRPMEHSLAYTPKT